MVLIGGPVVFEMGTPKADPDHQEEELHRSPENPAPVFIASTEVSNDEFKRYARSKIDYRSQIQYAVQPGAERSGSQGELGPEAAAYCNWLSEQEGLPRCYEPNGKGEYAEGMRVKAEAVTKGGYRLPTEVEWSTRALGGTITTRYDGQDVPSCLALTSGMSPRQDTKLIPVLASCPTTSAYSDTLANVMEWCHDRHLESNWIRGPAWTMRYLTRRYSTKTNGMSAATSSTRSRPSCGRPPGAGRSLGGPVRPRFPCRQDVPMRGLDRNDVLSPH